MTVRMRATHSHTGNRRSHHALVSSSMTKCINCGSLAKRHAVCSNCGKYKGREVVDTIGKVSKKDAKKKSK